MNKRLIITSSIALALIGGAVFATTRPALYIPSGAQIQPEIKVPTRSEVQAETKPETSPQPAQTTASAELNVTAPAAGTSNVDATATAPSAPSAPTPPRTVVNIIGSNVNGNARAGIDTFTCTYHFSDGTSESRETQYTFVPSSMPAALCPEWE